MAKRKPDQTVNLRLELQDYERKALASYQFASAIKDIANAIDQLTSFENMYVVATLIEITTGKEILPGTPNDVYQIIDAFRDYLKKSDGDAWYNDLLDILAKLPTAYGGLVD